MRSKSIKSHNGISVGDNVLVLKKLIKNISGIVQEIFDINDRIVYRIGFYEMEAC